MSLHSFKTQKSSHVVDWIKATKKRGQDNNVLKNPYVWNIKTIKRNDCLIVVVDAKPLLPNFSFMGWLCGLFVLMIWGATMWLIPCMILGCLGVFWTGEFMFFMTKKALKKAGYDGPIKRIKHSELIRQVVL